MAVPRVPRKITIGTDFSGMDMPVLALQLLGVSHQHVFGCDNNPKCRVYGESVYGTTLWYDDVSDRDITSAPYCDVFVWGAPCVSFSKLGKQRGVKDPRGQLGGCSLDYIRHHKPRLTIMEPSYHL